MRVVDYFAGLGGFTLGATRAGCDVVAAINHWPLAVDFHARNHPGVAHACEDLTRFDPSRLDGFDILAASPACQGHSLGSGVSQSSPAAARWDSSMPDVVRIGLREEGGALRTALIPVEKAALVGAAAALAAPPKQSKRARVERTNRADVRLTPTASQIVADEGLLRDDVAALLGRASMDGQKRATMTVREGRVSVFMLSARQRGDVFVWSAAVEGGPRG